MASSGQRGEYQWLVSEQIDIHRLLEILPEVALGKCLAISLFDSGPLVPTDEERSKGWQVHGRLTVVPEVVVVGDLPSEQYDEWYLFTSPTMPEIPETFANCGGFTLEPPQVSLQFARAQASVGAQADLKMIQQAAEMQQELLDSFWAQMERVRPDTYIGDGDHFVFVTVNSLLFEKVQIAVRSHESRGPRGPRCYTPVAYRCSESWRDSVSKRQRSGSIGFDARIKTWHFVYWDNGKRRSKKIGHVSQYPTKASAWGAAK